MRKNRANIIFFILLGIAPFGAQCKIPTFQTTRLKSTAGAGVASVLLNEATILNPSSLAFYNVSAVYYSENRPSYSRPDEDVYSDKDENEKSQAFIVSDAKGPFKGSISLVKNKRRGESEKIYAGAMATPMGNRSALGLTYKKITSEAENKETSKTENNTYHQFVIGALHALTESFTIGATFQDPFGDNINNRQVNLGSQFQYLNILTLMLDVGGSYYLKISKHNYYRLALQLSFLKDLYLRSGFSYSRITKSKETGVGIGWAGPKIHVDLALSYSSPIDTNTPNALDSRELSFALSYKF